MGCPLLPRSGAGRSPEFLGADCAQLSRSEMATRRVKKLAESQRGVRATLGDCDDLRWTLVKCAAGQSKAGDSSRMDPVEQAGRASGLLTHGRLSPASGPLAWEVGKQLNLVWMC